MVLFKRTTLSFAKRMFSNSDIAKSRKLSISKGNHQKFTVAVEGNIGCGKTTLLQYFEKFPDVKVLQEPVNKWRDLEGHNLLNLMYCDPEKWSFTFQSYVQLTMAEAHSKKHEFFERVKLLERSIFSARYCFVENLYKSGKLSCPDYTVLSKWFDFLIAEKNIHLDLIVYLQASPETVHHNVMTRGREEEKNISLEYLKDLHTLHEDWLIKRKSFDLPCPVLVLNADCDLITLRKLCQDHAEKILFMSQAELSPSLSTVYS